MLIRFGAVIVGISLLISLLLFPILKAAGAWNTVAAGYAVVAVSFAGVLIGVRAGVFQFFRRVVQQIPDWSFPYVVFGIAFVLRLLGAQLFPVSLYGDWASHEYAAWNLAQGVGYVRSSLGPDAHWPPGYSLMASLVYMVLGRNPIYLVTLNCLLDSLASVLVYFIGRQAFSDVAQAKLVAVAYTVNPLLLVASQITTYVPLLTTLLCMIVLLANRNSVVLGLLVGLGALVKPILLAGPIIIALASTLNHSVFGCLRRAVVVAIVMACIIAPWTVRNYRAFNRFLPISANGGWMLANGNNSQSDGFMIRWRQVAMKNDPLSVPGTDVIDLDRQHMRKGLNWIANNPIQFLALAPRKQAYMWGTEAATLPFFDGVRPNAEQGLRMAVQWFYISIAGLAAVGCIFCSRTLVSSPQLLMLCLLVIFAWTLHSIYPGWSYYHQPFLPFLTVMAGLGVTWLEAKWLAVSTAADC